MTLELALLMCANRMYWARYAACLSPESIRTNRRLDVCTLYSVQGHTLLTGIVGKLYWKLGWRLCNRTECERLNQLMNLICGDVRAADAPHLLFVRCHVLVVPFVGRFVDKLARDIIQLSITLLNC